MTYFLTICFSLTMMLGLFYFVAPEAMWYEGFCGWMIAFLGSVGNWIILQMIDFSEDFNRSMTLLFISVSKFIIVLIMVFICLKLDMFDGQLLILSLLVAYFTFMVYYVLTLNRSKSSGIKPL